jgi:rRNA maturation RNase YbeY
VTIDIRNTQRKFRVPRKALAFAARIALQSTPMKEADVSILLVNDRRIRQLNLAYRRMDKATDVLSFPMHSGDEIDKFHPALLGDVVISVERAIDQARDKGHSLKTELTFLLIHGILHLLGYDHEQSPREALRMKRKERAVLKRIQHLQEASSS